MFELSLQMPEGVEADEIELDDIKITLVPVSADKAAADDRYSAKMCTQPVELITAAISEMLPDPKRKRRRRVKKRLPVARRILPAMPRARARAPRRAVAARLAGNGGDTGDDGGGESSGDGGGAEPPGPRSRAVHVLGRQS